MGAVAKRRCEGEAAAAGRAPSTDELHKDAWNFSRKDVPNLVSELKGMSWSTARALPGMTRSSGPHMTALKRSADGNVAPTVQPTPRNPQARSTLGSPVVGSGPMRAPGKSRPIM